MSTPGTDPQSRIYRGASVEELVPRIQRELGAEAIILRQRQGLTGGVLGFFQRSFVELEAIPGGPRIDVYDEGEGSQAIPGNVPASPPLEPSPPTPARALTGHGAYVTEQLAALAMAGRAEPQTSALRHDPWPRPATPAAPGAQAPSPEHVLDSFAAALAEAESHAPPPQRMASHHPPSRPAPPRPIPARPSAEPTLPHADPVTPREPPQSATDRWTVPPPPRNRRRSGANIQKKLVGLGMSEDFAHELIDGANAHVLPLAPSGGLTRAVRVMLAQRIPVMPPLPTTGAAIVVVGAGGSGKTSYCAALMRAYRKQESLSASYANLTWDPEGAALNMLLSPHVMWPAAIGSPRSLRAVRRARGEGLLVLDAPELSPANRVGIRALTALIGELEPERVLVALPATLGAAAAAQLLSALGPLGANGLIITHADETDQIGVAVEAACTFGLAPEYLLDRNRSGGWRVGRLDPAGLAERLLR